MKTNQAWETILTSQDKAIGTITLNHGKVNALSKQLIDDLCAALEQMKADSMQVVILRAAKGVKVFSA